MRRTFSLYPKNRIATSVAMYQLPLKNISFSSEKNNPNYSNYSTALPKSTKIRKMIEEINSSNSNPKKINNNSNSGTNNLYNCQKLLAEEKLKNKNYYENIISLNHQIEELEFQLKNNCHNCQNCENININDELNKLRQENLELKLFKEKVFAFSKKYDELNINILNCLKSIEKIVQVYNDNIADNENTQYNNNLNIISDKFKSVIDYLTNFMDAKQEEYNALLIEKENEIEKLKNEYNCPNIDNFKNGFKSHTIKNKSYEKLYEYNNFNKTSDLGRKNQNKNFYKIYNTNEFNYGNNQRKIEFKSTFDNL